MNIVVSEAIKQIVTKSYRGVQQSWQYIYLRTINLDD